MQIFAMYSAIGSRKAQTRPSTFASAVSVRSIIAASSRVRTADDETEYRATPRSIIIVEMSTEAALIAEAAMRTTIGLRYWPLEKTARAARRESDRRHCGNRPDTGSP